MTTKYQTNLKAYNHDQQYNIWKLVLSDWDSAGMSIVLSPYNDQAAHPTAPLFPRVSLVL